MIKLKNSPPCKGIAYVYQPDLNSKEHVFSAGYIERHWHGVNKSYDGYHCVASVDYDGDIEALFLRCQNGHDGKPWAPAPVRIARECKYGDPKYGHYFPASASVGWVFVIVPFHPSFDPAMPSDFDLDYDNAKEIGVDMIGFLDLNPAPEEVKS
jgi:hypothetical protein